MKTLIVGSRVGKEEEGINFYEFDESKGTLHHHVGVDGIPQPTFQCFDHKRRMLYSVSETETDGHIYAYHVAADFSCTQRFCIPSTGGSPCHVALNQDGTLLSVANYGDGVLLVLDVSTAPPKERYRKAFPGKGTHPTRQERSHIHSSLFSSGLLYVADLGLDHILRYNEDLSSLSPLETPPGTGPRHMWASPEQRILYVAAELSSELLVYQKETLIQRISTLPEAFSGENTVADIHLSSDAQFLYCSNRGHDSVAIFKKNTSDGTLALIGHCLTEREPRNFSLSPSGRWLLAANGSSDSITIHPIDVKTGLAGAFTHRYELLQPVCLTFI
ncbi:MAG: lactonase family protein [Sphaerochaetaceae bacterium]